MSSPVTVFGRNMDVSKRLNDYVSKKASRLDRFLSDIDETRVDLAFVKSARSVTDRQVAQITVRGKKFVLRSEERAEDIFVAFDVAMEKMQRQIERYKGKRSRSRGDGKTLGETISTIEAEPEPAPEEGPLIARRKKFFLSPMDEIEAIEQMELLGHDNFFIFFNFNTDAINVIYRRRDGSFGLIEPELG